MHVLTRRNFLQSSLLLGGSLVTDGPRAFAGSKPASDTVNIGVIGCNGQGFADLKSMLKAPGTRCIALCDVDRRVLDRRVQDLKVAGHAAPTLYSDYRKLLDNKDIDVVIIGTPDHWHALQFTHALQAGRGIYCEKPVANSVAEADYMLRASKKYPQIVQVGQWQRSMQHFQDAVRFIQLGRLGTIRTVKAWAYIGWKKEVPVAPDSPAPAGVDYAMWLGPATRRPFNINRFHFNFRWFWDYAGGLMTDWGVHLIDYAMYAMDVESPVSVMAGGGKFAFPKDAQETPDTLTTIYEFPGFNLIWEQAMGIGTGNYGHSQGLAFIGNNGTLVLTREGWEVQPELDGTRPKMEALAWQKPLDNGMDRHTAGFVEAFRDKKPELLTAPLAVGHAVAVNAHLGNIAFKTGEKLHWDSATRRFRETDANRHFEHAYHNGWELPRI